MMNTKETYRINSKTILRGKDICIYDVWGMYLKIHLQILNYIRKRVFS